jgi:adenylate kinase family enzyme
VDRVSIVGSSGSGKSTFARQLAARLGAPHVELDALWHDAGWTNPSPEEFLRRVTQVTDGDRWVVDGNYARVTREGPVWGRADTVIGDGASENDGDAPNCYAHVASGDYSAGIMEWQS